MIIFNEDAASRPADSIAVSATPPRATTFTARNKPPPLLLPRSLFTRVFRDPRASISSGNERTNEHWHGDFLLRANTSSPTRLRTMGTKPPILRAVFIPCTLATRPFSFCFRDGTFFFCFFLFFFFFYHDVFLTMLWVGFQTLHGFEDSAMFRGKGVSRGGIRERVMIFRGWFWHVACAV